MFSLIFWMSLPRATSVPWTPILQVTSLPPVVGHPYGLRMPRPYDYAHPTSGIFLTWENHHHHPPHHYLCNERMSRSIVKAVPIKFGLKKQKQKQKQIKWKRWYWGRAAKFQRILVWLFTESDDSNTCWSIVDMPKALFSFLRFYPASFPELMRTLKKLFTSLFSVWDCLKESFPHF